MTKRKVPRLNPARLFMDLSVGHSHGEDAEVAQENANRANVPYDPQRPILEFRDLTVATAGSGGYLVETEVQEAIDMLRPWSVMTQAGILIRTGLVGSQTVPRVSAKSTPAWQSAEATQITASQPTLVQIASSPKQVGVVITFSRQLALQTNADFFVRRELMRTVGSAIDQALLNGSGVSGQPQGLIGTSGVQTQSGTTLNTGVLTMKKLSAEANVTDTNISFLSTPAVRALLEAREVVTGSGKFVWQDERVAARPAFVSTDVPTAVMVAGDFSLLLLNLWGNGFQVEIDPTTGFKTGVISARILVSCDVVVLQPTGYVVASSIT
jgi:HK97 family phage major capsid protein